MTVSKLCRAIPSIQRSATLKRAANILIESGQQALVVLDDKKPIGILSAYEILEKTVGETDLEETQVSNVMNPAILTIEAGQTPEEAGQTMLAHKHWMAVVTEKGEYKGVVTAEGLLKELDKG